jgi:hypothetical protein
MSLQYSVTLRDNQLAQIQATVESSAAGSLVIYGGATAVTVPSACSVAATGTVLATMTLPDPFMTTAAAGTVTMTATWPTNTTVTTAGTAAYFRVLDSSSNVHMQGTCVGTPDLTLNNTVLAAGQTITVTQFSVSAGNQ